MLPGGGRDAGASHCPVMQHSRPAAAYRPGASNVIWNGMM